MPLKTILFMIGFVVACAGALYAPLIGVVAYVLHYHITPESQWWGGPLARYGIRYSFVLAACTAIGFAVRFRALRYGRSFFTRHEWLIVLFLCLIWLSTIIAPGVEATPTPTGESGGYVADPPEIKFMKVVIFLLIITHVVTTRKNLTLFLWAMIIGTLYLSYQGCTAPRSMFATGRLTGIGGPDFSSTNGYAGYLAACLPIIGVQFLRSGWKGKLLCLLTGVLTVNAIVLTRSRGAIVALAGGAIVAIFLAPKRFRRKIVICVIVAAIGGFALTDPGFWTRASTITAGEGERDVSAQSRFDIWGASITMLGDHPLGVGAGNFPQAIHRYLPQYPPKDAHNTYVLCYSELGVQGIVVYLLVILSAARLLWGMRKRSQRLPKEQRDDVTWLTYGLAVSLTIVVLRGMTMSRLYTEGPWWILALPLCLARATDNLMASPVSPREAREGKEASGQSPKRKVLRTRYPQFGRSSK